MIETLGCRLKKLREEKHLKQEQVAGLIDVTRSAICCYENDTRQPPYDVLVRLAILYRVSTDFLLGCQSQDKNMIDISGLSPRDAAIIQVLVNTMEERQEDINCSEDKDYRRDRK